MPDLSAHDALVLGIASPDCLPSSGTPTTAIVVRAKQTECSSKAVVHAHRNSFLGTVQNPKRSIDSLAANTDPDVVVQGITDPSWQESYQERRWQSI
jgi:hypothetical protein